MVPNFWGHFLTLFDPLFGGSKKGSKNGPKIEKTPFFGQKTQKIEFFLIFPTPIFAFFAFPHPPLPKNLGGGPILDPKKRPFLGLFRGPNQRGFQRWRAPPIKCHFLAHFWAIFGVCQNPKNGVPKIGPKKEHFLT